MNSWDLFDTLVACRRDAPAGEYRGELFPIAETIARVQPDDIVVSDYYTKELAEGVLRNVAKLPNRIVVSQHGKFEGVIWPQLGSIEQHHGDNPTGDYAMPMRHGIQSELITLAQLTGIEKMLRDDGMPGLALACREARLTTWHPQLRQSQLLQVQANFPMLVLAGLALHEFAEAQGAKRVLMSARDCCLWVDLQRDICNQLHGGYEVEYFPSSRLCRVRPSTRYLLELNNRLVEGAVLVDIGGTGESLARLIKKSVRLDTPTFLATQYPWREDEAIDLPNLQALTRYYEGGILEFANAALHGMFTDWGQVQQTTFQWNCDETRVMHAAFHLARRVLELYPLPTYKEGTFHKLLAHVPVVAGWQNSVHEGGCLKFLAAAFDEEQGIGW